MDRRHWSYDPEVPPQREPDGWVVVGDEPEEYPATSPNVRPYVRQHENRRDASRDTDYGRYQARHSHPDRPVPGYPAEPPEPYWDGPAPDRQEPYWQEPRWETQEVPPAPSWPPPEGYPQPYSGRPGPPGPGPPGPGPPGPRPLGPAPPGPGQLGPPVPPQRSPVRDSPARGPAPPVRPPLPPAPDEPEEKPGAPWGVVLAWTACYFLVPVLVYLVWALTRSGVAVPGCVDAAGEPCMSPRADAITRLLAAGPALGGAFVLAVLVSLGLRWLTVAWRPSTVGFAAAVIGAGLATLVVSVVS